MPIKISPVEREFILGQVQAKAIPVRVHGAGKTVTCTVAELGTDKIVLAMKGLEASAFSGWEPVSTYIDFLGQPICFTSKVRKVEGTRVILALPELFLKSPRRRHVRVPCPKNCELSFFLHDGNVPLDYPKSQEYSDVERPETQATFDDRSLQHLVDSFKRQIAGIAGECRIIMFKDRKPESLDERIVSRLGRVLFIPSMKSGLPTTDPYPEGRIVTRRAEEDFEGPVIFTEGSEFERSLASKAERGLSAEIFCPILYYQYVIGYVYLAAHADKGSVFDFSHIEYVWDFARFVAYFLKGANYFTSDGPVEPTMHSAAIVDISVSGCLLAVPRVRAGLSIKLGTIIKLRLEHGSETLGLKGKAVRKFEDDTNDYYGLSFGSVPLADQARLFGILYAYPFDADALPQDESAYRIG